MRKKTQEEFIQQLNNKFNNKFDTKEVNYINNKTPVILTCKDCGLRKEYRPDTILAKRTIIGCFKCELVNKKDRAVAKRNKVEELIERAKEIHGLKYDYEFVEYKALSKKVKLKCNACGNIFEQSLEKHLAGQGCPKCAGRERTTEEAIKIIKNIYGDIYDFKEFKYINATTKSKLICKKHNKEIKVSFHTLTSSYKDRKCCSCEWQSSANLYIKKLLDEKDIENIPEYIFKDCKNIEPLKFDFYLPKYNCVVEFQGVFHFKDIYGDLKLQQKRDEIKRKYCKEKGIIEIEIPYWNYKHIESIISNSIDKLSL